MNESVLEVGDMDAFAERLGIGSRHLRRLFLKHLGASPIAVAQTRRLHFAKKLIDESRLPMRDVAIASGFGSVRRFNATFLKTYRRTPTQLRKVSRPAASAPNSGYRFLLRFRPPFCWVALLEFLAPRAIPGIEIVEGQTYRRVFSLENHVGSIQARLDDASESIVLSIHYPQPQWLFLIVERVRRLFDLSADPNEIALYLRRDPLLTRRIAGRRPRDCNRPAIESITLRYLKWISDGVPRARTSARRSRCPHARNRSGHGSPVRRSDT